MKANKFNIIKKKKRGGKWVYKTAEHKHFEKLM
jgi:hypothetical protein